MHSCRSSDEVHWVDAKTAIRRAHPKANGDVLVHIPFRNALTLTKDMDVLEHERTAFLGALGAADNSWNIPSLGAIRSAIASKEESLSQLDPRCRVKLTSSSSNEQLEVFLTGEEPLTLQMSLQLKSVVDRERLREALDTGAMREISVDSLHLSGSPLIDRVIPNGMSGKLNVGGNAIGSMRVRLAGTPRESGKRLYIDLQGAIVRGRLGGSVHAISDAHPFYVELQFIDGKKQVRAQFGVDQARLSSRELSTQSELLNASNALRAIFDSGNLELSLSSKHGEIKDRLVLGVEDIDTFRDLSTLFLQLDDLREIALTYASNIRIGDFKRSSSWEPYWWHIARRILDGEAVAVGIKEVSWMIQKSPPPIDEASYKNGTFVVYQAPLRVQAFGDLLCEIPVDASFRGYHVGVEEAEGGSQIFRLTRSAISVCRMRRSSSGSFTDADAESLV